MDAINNGGPAFPVEFATLSISPSAGMTLRDYFAAKALAMLDYNVSPDSELAALAYKMADAMLAAREVQP